MSFDEALQWLNSQVLWGVPMSALLLGTGFYLMLGLRLMPLRRFGQALRLLWGGRSSRHPGEISPFNALMTALAATVGTGNIVGVATAIGLGGPGALFWMWCTALVGMATKYTEAVLAVKFRVRTETGSYAGGPMYYIRHGLGPRWAWLALLFALFGAGAAFGIGNTVQAHSVADALASTFAIPREFSAVAMMVLVGLVVLGGVRRIGRVAGVLVPFMALAYMAAGLAIIALHAQQLPAVVWLVIDSAFTGQAAVGGFAGAGVWAALRFGVARGIFSNEAGLGSAPIAHAAAQTDDPVRQGMVAMLGTFIDTLLVCSVTGFAILLTGSWMSGEQGAPLSIMAFQQAIPGGGWLVTIALSLFAFTTLLGWSYYGERCVSYLFGERALTLFRVVWVLAIPVGALAQLNMIWLVADVLNALMALPNLIALLLLSPLVFRLTRDRLSAGPMAEAPDQASI